MARSQLLPAWILTGVLACFDLLFLPFAGFSVSAPTLSWVLGAAALLLSGALFYGKFRTEPSIVAALSGAALIIAYSAIVAIYSYLITAAALPLQDSVLATLDEAVGFHFVDHLRWIAGHPRLRRALEMAYFSCPLQLVIIICGLAFVDSPALGRFLNVYALSAIAVVTLAGLFPAAGAYLHHPISPDVLAPYHDINAGRWHLDHFEALRAGTFKRLSLETAEGLVTFPSFHAVLAIIFAHALWGLPYLRWLGLPLNAGMMLSALSIGGHYLTDLVGGALIAVASLFWIESSGKTSPVMTLDPRTPHV